MPETKPTHFAIAGDSRFHRSNNIPKPKLSLRASTAGTNIKTKLALLALVLFTPASHAETVPPPPEMTTPATWCRFVPERMDDFAWENDLVAFRTYGPALAMKGSGEDSGIDVWLKRVKYPIIDRWYGLMQKGFTYHKDYGEGNDPYHVGPSRGCGSTAIWKDGEMVLPGPYKEWEIESREPQRSIFSLTYEYKIDGKSIREVKKISIEMGSRLFRAESTFTENGEPVQNLEIAIGITTHGNKAKVTFDQPQGWMSCWETIEGLGLGTGVVIPPGAIVEMKEHLSPNKETHALLITRTNAEGRTMHFAGYGWAGAGEITTEEQWQKYLSDFASQSN
jgi:hypothetical protein